MLPPTPPVPTPPKGGLKGAGAGGLMGIAGAGSKGDGAGFGTKAGAGCGAGADVGGSIVSSMSTVRSIWPSARQVESVGGDEHRRCRHGMKLPRYPLFARSTVSSVAWSKSPNMALSVPMASSKVTCEAMTQVNNFAWELEQVWCLSPHPV